MSGVAVPAFRFDGRLAEATPVVLRVDDACLVVEAPDGTLLERERLDRAVVSEPFESAPRLVSLPNGATLEIADDGGAFARELTHAGLGPSPIVRLQRWTLGVVIALAAVVALLAVLYVKGLPAAARWAAFALPPQYEARMGTELLAVLDRHYLKPSRLEVTWRAQTTERFARAAAPTAPGVTYRLEFRRAGKQVNAFALPGGIIVLLDGLVDVTEDDDGVLGVLGHELGHVVHKHSVRQLFQSVGVGTLASLLWGDFSGAAAGIGVALGVMHYSRDFEREADEFAVAFLRNHGVSVRPLYEFFESLRHAESRKGATIPDFLSTHPSTDERLDRLRREMQ